MIKLIFAGNVLFIVKEEATALVVVNDNVIPEVIDLSRRDHTDYFL